MIGSPTVAVIQLSVASCEPTSRYSRCRAPSSTEERGDVGHPPNNPQFRFLNSENRRISLEGPRRSTHITWKQEVCNRRRCRLSVHFVLESHIAGNGGRLGRCPCSRSGLH